jgi:IS5 family transposase
VEEALYDSNSMRRFVGIDLGREPAPDDTTVCKFRHLIERHGLAEKMFASVNRYLAERGLRVSNSTTVDATIIQAPSSTKNRDKQRDPVPSPFRICSRSAGVKLSDPHSVLSAPRAR